MLDRMSGWQMIKVDFKTVFRLVVAVSRSNRIFGAKEEPNAALCSFHFWLVTMSPRT